MPYSKFTLPEVVQRIDQSVEDLFPGVAPRELSPHLAESLKRFVPVALAVGTGKIKSELIVAPILGEVWDICDGTMGLFSGVDFNVAPELELVGRCDFILTHSPEQLYVQSPVAAIAEAKNDDIKSGFARCIAAMLAAQIFNERDNVQIAIYGAATNGTVW